MKIVLISVGGVLNSRSGVGVMVSSIARELASFGHEVSVITDNPHQNSPDYSYSSTIKDNITYFSVTIPNSHRFSNRYTVADYRNQKMDEVIRTILLQCKPEILHMHAIQGFGAGIINVALELKIKTVVTMHDWWWIDPNFFLADLDSNSVDLSTYDLESDLRKHNIRFPINFVRNRTEYLLSQLKKTSLITSCSDFLSASFLKHTGIKSLSLPNFVDITPPPHIRVRKKEDRIQFAFFGGLSSEKGFDLLYNALHDLQYADLELHVYGVGTSALRLLVERFIEKKKVAYSSIIRSLVKDVILKLKEALPASIYYYRLIEHTSVANTMSKYDFVAIPSRVNESFSLVAHEALACNRPVLASNAGNLNYVIKPYKNGLLFKTGDLEDLKLNLSEMRRLIKNSYFSTLEKPSTMTVGEYTHRLVSLYTKSLNDSK